MQDPTGKPETPKVVPPWADIQRIPPPAYIGNANAAHDRIIVAKQPPEVGQKGTGGYTSSSKYEGHLSKGISEKARGQRG